jgi:hypothetical protein
MKKSRGCRAAMTGRAPDVKRIARERKRLAGASALPS